MIDDIFTRDIELDLSTLRRSSYGRSLGEELLDETCAYLRSLDAAAYSACIATMDTAMAGYALA
jgi:hypothetical protein